MPYAIGTQFITAGKHGRLCTVIDILSTFNHSGELVKTRYIATHEMMGQVVVDHDVNDVTVARGIDRLNESSLHVA